MSIQSHLESLALCADQGGYLKELRFVASLAREEHRECIRLASAHPDPAVRCEALTVVLFAAPPDLLEVLRSSRRSDPEVEVRSWAEALLFRAIAAGRQRGLGLDAASVAAHHEAGIVEAIEWRFAANE